MFQAMYALLVCPPDGRLTALFQGVLCRSGSRIRASAGHGTAPVERAKSRRELFSWASQSHLRCDASEMHSCVSQGTIQANKRNRIEGLIISHPRRRSIRPNAGLPPRSTSRDAASSNHGKRVIKNSAKSDCDNAYNDIDNLDGGLSLRFEEGEEGRCRSAPLTDCAVAEGLLWKWAFSTTQEGIKLRGF
ncbi:uncharacterized protein RCO7_14654 [Rhynchosporium graminicola]|uniref:Uncharacterized protein n=1 Tax=Rhynchosporium graminicola TaxID=2792576 RepID=A0A1E1KUJ2_9HELO|nr:uncharacterized protein RCO7_14654 [Rhynchosporium commune]